MNFYLLFYDCVAGYTELRAPFRDEHLRLAAEASARGELLLGGALADPPDRAVLVFKASGPEVVKAFVDADPYVKNGLVTRWEIRRWTVAAGALLSTDGIGERL